MNVIAMKRNEYMKTLVFVALICGGSCSVYLFYDYLIDGNTARTICENNCGTLPVFNSSNFLDEPYWVDSDTCNISGCAQKKNGTCQPKPCKKKQKLFCLIDYMCIDKITSRQNVSEMNSTNFQTDIMDCEETCCKAESCLGINYENDTCFMYEEGFTEKEIFLKLNIIHMEYDENTTSETIYSCVTTSIYEKTKSILPSYSGSIRTTKTYRTSYSTFKGTTSYMSSTPAFTGESSMPTSSLVSSSSATYFSTTEPLSSVINSASSPDLSTKPSLDLTSPLAPSFSSECTCQCFGPTTSLSEEESKSKMSKLREELTIPKKDLSSTIRKKTSAPDYRVSATSIGLVGVGIMCVVFGTIIVMDIGVMASHLGILYRNVCGRWR